MAVTAPVDETKHRILPWERSYLRRLFVTDLIIICAAVFGAQLIRFGISASALHANSGLHLRDFVINHTILSIVLVTAWMLSLSYFATRDNKATGSGSTEYRRVIDATGRLFGALAIVAFLLRADPARGYILVAFPSGIILLLLGRWVWRQWLNRKRRDGEFAYRALVLGHRSKSEHVVHGIQRTKGAGLRVVGALTKHGSVETALATGTPVMGTFSDVMDALDRTRADTLILTGADDIGPREMRSLGWDLESRGVRLVVAPALTDVAGPRIHARPVAGLPLIYVDYPSFEGRKHVAKRAFDIFSAFTLLTLLAPVFLWISIAVRRGSPGPAFFRQDRIGLNGKSFRMLKFRSMVSDAEAQLPSLLDQSQGNGILFKMREDPRVTKVGAFLRRHSLDELPQLLNVLRGDMSLVGPRPPLAQEVQEYDDWARRRLLVKPGITGLWQVSGRSDLSWDDSLRLDLYYVENWSLTGDVVILYRTIKAVVRPTGAY